MDTLNGGAKPEDKTKQTILEVGREVAKTFKAASKGAE